jgi:hypothetical protein
MNNLGTYQTVDFLPLLNSTWGLVALPSVSISLLKDSVREVVIEVGGWRGTLWFGSVNGLAYGCGFCLCESFQSRVWHSGPNLADLTSEDSEVVSLFRAEESEKIRSYLGDQLDDAANTVLDLLTFTGETLGRVSGEKPAAVFKTLEEWKEFSLSGEWFQDDEGRFYLDYGPSGFPPSTGRWQGNPEFPWVGFEQFMDGLR